MSAKKSLQFAVGILLVMFYLVVFVCLLHPHVTREYQAFYIDRVSSDWNPVRYPATMEEGITFSAPGLPTFVDYLYGFSYRDSWGRWTDARRSPAGDRAAAEIGFAESLKGPICVCLNARAARPGEPITLVMGDQQTTLNFSRMEFFDYFIDFSPVSPAHTLAFRFPGRIRSPHEENSSNPDTRRLGLAMVSLKVFRSTCLAAQKKIRGLTALESTANGGFEDQ